MSARCFPGGSLQIANRKGRERFDVFAHQRTWTTAGGCGGALTVDVSSYWTVEAPHSTSFWLILPCCARRTADDPRRACVRERQVLHPTWIDVKLPLSSAEPATRQRRKHVRHRAAWRTYKRGATRGRIMNKQCPIPEHYPAAVDLCDEGGGALTVRTIRTCISLVTSSNERGRQIEGGVCDLKGTATVVCTVVREHAALDGDKGATFDEDRTAAV
eukprot:59082-Prymnesium_polylepis.2